jgi:hypothetical protein
MFLKESHFMHDSYAEATVSTGLLTVSKATQYTGRYMSGCVIIIWVLFHAAVSGRITLSEQKGFERMRQLHK